MFYKEDPEKALRVPMFELLNNPIPKSIDWYKEGKVTKPTNQGSCGACWAFTAAATLESLAAITGHDQEV